MLAPMIEEMEPIESGISVSCSFSSSSSSSYFSSSFSSSLRSCLIFEDEDEGEGRPEAEGGYERRIE